MRSLAAVAVFMLAVAPVAAQSQPDLGGVSDFAAKVVKQTRGGTAVGLDETVHGVLYVPFPSLHSADGNTEYAVFGVGADLSKGVSGTRLRGSPLLLPMLNAGGVLSLLTRQPWVKSHTSFADIGNVSGGIGVLPAPIPGSHGKWVIGRQVEGVITFGFGKGGS